MVAFYARVRLLFGYALAKEPNIREVIAFPKNGWGDTLSKLQVMLLALNYKSIFK